MSTSNPSQHAPVSVDLRCDFPGAEVVLVDGQQRLIARGQQRLQKSVPPGIYIVRVIVGDSLRDEHVIVRPDKPLTKTFTPPPVASAIPLEGSARSHEYHQSVARNPKLEIPLHADGTASIFVLLREWTPEGVGQRAAGPLAPELRLCSADGSILHAFDTDMADTGPLDRSTAQGVRVRPGFYRLMSRSGDVTVEMPVYAIQDWQTQIYLLSEFVGEGLAPDFGRASIFWARPGSGFDPNRPDLLVLESVRAAAESGRGTVTNRGLTDALYEKFDNPMLGLVSAHALRVRKAIDTALLALVTTNLERILGPIPDVSALKLALDPQAGVPPIEYPPILRWSWELLIDHSVERPDLIRRHSLAEQVGGCVIDRGVFLSWVADQQAAATPPLVQSIGAEYAVNAVRQTWQQMADVRGPAESRGRCARVARNAGSVRAKPEESRPDLWRAAGGRRRRRRRPGGRATSSHFTGNRSNRDGSGQTSEVQRALLQAAPRAPPERPGQNPGGL